MFVILNWNGISSSILHALGTEVVPPRIHLTCFNRTRVIHAHLLLFAISPFRMIDCLLD